MNKYQKMFYDIKNTSDYKTVGEDIDYKVIVDDEAKEVVLQFEESDSRQDWKHNFMFLPWLLKLEDRYVITTHGYACAYSSAKGEPMTDFLEKIAEHIDYKCCIRGWSFGSAMAKIATRHFYIKTNLSLDEEVTFGDVKCWFNPFAFLLSRKWCKDRKEFVTVNDFVTWQVPFFVRTRKCEVGDRFSFKKIFNTEYMHTHYEEYNYSKYE